VEQDLQQVLSKVERFSGTVDTLAKQVPLLQQDLSQLLQQ
jgi:hypothetical protein